MTKTTEELEAESIAREVEESRITDKYRRLWGYIKYIGSLLLILFIYWAIFGTDKCGGNDSAGNCVSFENGTPGM